MFDKLNEVEKRYEEINSLICLPEVVGDMQRYTALMKELKHLSPVVEKFREYKKTLADIEDCRAVLGDSSADEELAAMARTRRRASSRYCCSRATRTTIKML